MDASHAQLVTMQQPNLVSISVTGTHSVNWERLEINEGGNAATCAWRTEKNTGESGTLNFNFTSPLEPSGAVNGLPLASGTGAISGSGATELFADTQTADLEIVDNQTGSALCGSTGCTSGDFGAYDLDRTEVMEVEYLGGYYDEKFCRTLAGGFRYTFTGGADISGMSGPTGPGMTARVLLYTGEFDPVRWGLSLPLDAEFTLSDETEVGTVRGFPIKARYITFSVDHAFSNSTGSESNCPTPGYSSEVQTGTTEATIEATVSG